MAGTDPRSLLAPTVRERARILAPCLLATLVFFLVGAGPLGIRPESAWYVAAWIPVGVLAVLTVALVRRSISDRWIHLASFVTLWCPLAATLLAFYATRNPAYMPLLVTLVTCAGVLLHTGFALGAITVAVGLGTLLAIRTETSLIGMYTITLVTAGSFAVLIHLLMRRAILRVELLRRTEAEQRERLASQVAELERAQAERASLADQLLHAQRMEAVGTLAAGIAHDMNNVLAAITSYGALALDETQAPGVRADIEQILQQAERGAVLTRGLLAFSRRGQYRKQVVRIGAVIENVLPLLHRTLPKSIAIDSELAFDSVHVEADPVHLQQVLINLGLNAADAMDGTGKLTIRGSVEGRFVQIVVRDTGKGMDATTKLRVFEPFFTTKAQGQGTGLGLAIVWGIVQAHEGTIDVDSQPGQGATFRIRLPITERMPAIQSFPSADAAQLGCSGTVLVIEDEATVRTSAKRLLEKLGMKVLVACNGEEGLKVFSRAATEVGLVVLDMGMPIMGGAECFRLIREQSAVPILIATGYASDHEAQELVAAGATILEKPYSSSAFKTEVTRLLQR